MLDYDPIAGLQHYPTSMRRFGLTQFNEPLYRIVFGPSRRFLNVRDWDDTGIPYGKWRRMYRHMGNIWIMERWRSAEEWKADQWDVEHLGPIPARGEYDLCHAFELSGPEDANLDKLVAAIEFSRGVRLVDTMQFHRDEAEREKQANGAKVEDMIRNRLPAFGCRPMFSGRTRRGTEKVHGNVNLRYTAQEAGLPTTPGMRQVLQSGA
jgi:hypothetical protein